MAEVTPPQPENRLAPHLNFHECKDTGSPLTLSQTMFDAIKAAGGDKIKLTIDPNAVTRLLDQSLRRPRPLSLATRTKERVTSSPQLALLRTQGQAPRWREGS